MSRDKRVTFVVSKKFKNRLEDIKKKTGLSVSEIGRRGLINELRELEADN
jgi:hypothetical protein